MLRDMRALLTLSLLSLCVAGPALAAGPQPGDRFSVSIENLPPPLTRSAANPPRKIPLPPDAAPTVPDGFTVTRFAEGLTHARWLTVAPNGDVLLAEPKAGHITLLRDADGDGRAELKQTFAEGFNEPHGLAVHDGSLWVADVDAVWRVAWTPGQTRGGERTNVTLPNALGDGNGHSTRILALDPANDRLFVAIGSRGNIEEEPLPRASIQRFALDGSAQATFASGLRNPVGLAIRPGTSELWTVVNERDGLGDQLVPDYLTQVQEGQFYGWPYSYLGQHPQPGFAKRRPDLVAKAVAPDLLFQAHSAPLGLVFYDGSQFPPEYRGDAFVALHGSWNRSDATGYMVVRVPFKDGRPDRRYQAFATGFQTNPGSAQATVWGRPCGLAVTPDGSLLVADDAAQVVWRISYQR